MIETEHLGKLLDASSLEDLWEIHKTLMAGYGFDRLLYGYTRYKHLKSLGDPDDFVLLSSHSAAYTDAFVGKGLYRNAPMVRWSLENEGACSWSVLHDLARTNRLTAHERRILAFNRAHDVIAGYTISFRSVSPRSKGAIGLTARPGLTQKAVDEIWRAHGDDILVLNNILHLCILSLPHAASGRALTARQSEVLSWVADGKTVRDIAQLMNVTPATIEKHLRLAREKLSVQTTAQAVLKAAMQNQIDQAEP